MKNWILTAAALFVFTTAATAAANAPDDDKRPDRTPMKGRMVENRTVKFDALPEAAQAFIRDFYAKDRVERIRFDPSAHLFAYKVRLDNGDEIMFSQNGAWTDIESADGIPMKLIPQQVADYVKNKYSGQTVTDIGLERNGISVRLADQTELLFDSDEHNLRQHMAGTRTKGSGDRMRGPPGNGRQPPGEAVSSPPPTSALSLPAGVKIVPQGALALFLRESGMPSHTSGIRSHKPKQLF